MQLFVGGLSDDTTEEDVNRLFSKICQVESVTIIKDIESGKSKGFGIVKVLSNEQGEEAVTKLNGTVLRNRQIAVTRMPETLPGEMEFREWLRQNASEVLTKVGVREGQTVLDYGCGPGTFTLPSARIVGKEGRLYALEVRSSVLEHVKDRARNEGLANIETVLSDSSKPDTGLQDESVDAILVYDVIHEIDDRLGLLQELHRVLRRDGFLSIFPMHMGTDSMLDIMSKCGLFCFRERHGPSGYKAASEILNFDKCQPK